MASDVFLIAGPTASGKSARALAIAKQTDGAIINTDSMQVYDILQVITARPSAREIAEAPHHLYGHVSPSIAYSTGQWMRAVKTLLQSLPIDQPKIFVGGTGLYFRALAQGLSPMPDIDEHVRERWRYRLNEEGAPKLHRILRSIDPEMAMTLKPNDGQRIARALEVLESSGKSILYWQNQTGTGLIDMQSARKEILLPDRAVLHHRINERFARMAQSGAVDEVKAIMVLGLDRALPAMKAIGVPQISAALTEQISWDDAITQAQAATRQYAKRQMTWFRQQMDTDWVRLES